MREKKFTKFIRKHLYALAVALCFLSVAGMTGIYFYEQSREKPKKELVDLNEMAKDTRTPDSWNSGTGRGQDNAVASSQLEQNVAESFLDSPKEWDMISDSQEAKAGEQAEVAAAEAAAIPDQQALAEDTLENHPPAEGEALEVMSRQADTLKFSEADTLGWPVPGNILMNYSMDKTVYFSTLREYKYNPAIVIQAAVNDKVEAAADGIVTEISTNEETGNTVKISLGSGYEAVYGQLKGVELLVGDQVERGDLVGYVNEPTKYYSVEGSSLYFALYRDGKPVDPVNYLE